MRLACSLTNRPRATWKLPSSSRRHPCDVMALVWNAPLLSEQGRCGAKSARHRTRDVFRGVFQGGAPRMGRPGRFGARPGRIHAQDRNPRSWSSSEVAGDFRCVMHAFESVSQPPARRAKSATITHMRLDGRVDKL